MKLLELRIKGFKSFVKNTTLNLDANVVSIVGPNGSGKSNIVDAIRWLLGEQSSKQMRIEEKFDVIFSGTEKLPPAKKAEVFIKIEDDEGRIRTLGKILSADGKIQYKIDNRNVRLKDLIEVMGGAGVGKSFYSIIGQDQVKELIAAPSELLRALIEDAAGIKVYLDKKEIALRMLEQTKENLERLNDILYEVEKRVRSLSNRASRAKKYVEYNKELKEIGVKYFGAKNIKISEKIQEIENKILENKSEVKELLAKSFEVERLYRELKAEIEEKDEKLSAYGEKLENFKQRLDSYEKMKTHLEDELKQLNSAIVENSWEKTKFEEDYARNKKRFEEIRNLIEKYENELSKLNEEITEVENEKKEIEASISKEMNKLTSLKEKLKRLIEERKEYEKTKNELISEQGSKDERLKFLKTEKENYAKKIEELEEKLKVLEKDLEHYSKKEKELMDQIEEKKSETEELHRSVSETYEYLQKLRREEDLTKRKIENLKLQISDYEGFSYAIKKLFEAFHNDENIVDVVLNLIEVPEELETAITTIAGFRLQNVVIKRSSQVSSYIKYLKAERAGRVTFLPLDLINSNLRRVKELEYEPGFYGYAVDLVSYDPEYEKVIKYVFGNSIIVDRLETALEIKNRMKNVSLTIATVSGEIINTSGAITGGASKNNNQTLLLSRKRELAELEESLKEIEEEISLNEKNLEKVEYNYKRSTVELKKLEEKLNEIRYNHLNGKNSYKDFKKEYSNAKHGYEEVLSRIDTFEDRINEIEEELKELEIKINDNVDLQKKIEIEIEEIEKSNKTIDNELRKKIARLDELNLHKNSVLSKISEYEKERNEVKNNLRSIENHLESLENKFKQLKNEMEQKSKELEDYEEEIKRINEEMNEAFQMLKKSREGKKEKFEELEQYEKLRNEIKDKIDDLKNAAHELDLEKQNLIHEKDFLFEKAKNMGIDTEEFVFENLNDMEIMALERRIEDIKKALKHIGSVDLAVLDEYEMVKKDLDDRYKQKEDILKSIKTLQEGIDKIDQEAEEKYLKTFNFVNEKFGEFIKELFVGGDGLLKMFGEGKAFEKGVEISVKKPGRNFQKLQLFSGGEKALITSAFLFALMNVNPSPFYVLDEIDAPLDDINAGKLAKLIRKHADKTQFLVITHNKLMMEIADIFHGITMRDGVTHVVPVDFKFMENLN
ncbi:chromosome segregation protein SMC [Marinitoga piezophila KA3]|uniref:Chromosome partition protein Smc n=1 Tax=Marinitoga piezophila (strain DSM 14283 / JCM 11233 / KA3) TaxID=443254 RepID=H2J884_MARPK|nr:chromosome segregation protein SMC [Marinitoga piezophila]AEX85568.1 chromosome segregation protein SMC [Marinitoga piezophila KA3]